MDLETTLRPSLRLILRLRRDLNSPHPIDSGAASPDAYAGNATVKVRLIRRSLGTHSRWAGHCHDPKSCGLPARSRTAIAGVGIQRSTIERGVGLDDEDRTRLRQIHSLPRSPDRYVQREKADGALPLSYRLRLRGTRPESNRHHHPGVPGRNRTAFSRASTGRSSMRAAGTYARRGSNPPGRFEGPTTSPEVNARATRAPPPGTRPIRAAALQHCIRVGPVAAWVGRWGGPWATLRSLHSESNRVLPSTKRARHQVRLGGKVIESTARLSARRGVDRLQRQESNLH